MTRKTVILVLLLLNLVGCAPENKHQDLVEFMADTRKRPSGELPELPPFIPYEAFAYSAATLRSPFDKPIPVDEAAIKGGRTVVPDLTRASEFLEGFNITSLKMVGSVVHKGKIWSLISTPDGNVVRATTGNYLGKNYGKIITVTPSQIEVMEIVSNGAGGWVENPRIIKLEEKE